jgi:signal transduction histidine kinase
VERTQQIDEQLDGLAAYLATRRPAILRAWRDSVDADPELTSASSLPRTQFNDHIPELLDAFEHKLRALPRPESPTAEEQQKEKAAGHGLQRWQQGYQLREVTREWGHLHLCLVDQVEAYSSAHPGTAPEAMAIARRALAEFCNDGVSESTLRYFQLQQTEAVGHVRDLDQTLKEAQQLESKRAELLRQAAHDLRGNLGTVKNVTSVLSLDGIAEAKREEFLGMLKRSVSSLHTMLDDVMNLARLQAGHELRDVKPFDAAVVLGELCESLQLMAAERDLFLKHDGPASLLVEGDAVKIRRIAQNLLLNALKYTPAGGVTLSWGDSRNNDPKRWMLCVQDTGPGFHAGPGAPLAGALKEATTDAREVEQRAGTGKDRRGVAEPPAPVTTPSDPRSVHQERGEGVGLSIVKRLCEMLDATLELESKPNEGTTFRVVFPRRYDEVGSKR